MLLIGGHERRRTRTQRGPAVQNGHFHPPFENQDHLLVKVVMRRMRRLAWGQLGDVQLDRKAGVRRAFQHRSHAIRPTAPHRKVLESESFG
jgi:hypothetical protein